MIVRNSTQCLNDKRNPFANVRPGEGCQVSGSMKVNKVAGNFHMTLGESFVRDGAHIHQFIPSEAPGFNVSHTIHSLSFGETYPSMPPNPLDNGISLLLLSILLLNHHLHLFQTNQFTNQTIN